MRQRLIPMFAFVGMVFVPLAAPAAEEAPSLIIRVRSIDSLLGDAKYLLAAVGQEEVGKQIDGFIKSQVGNKGLEGIDTKRAIGFYGTVGPNGVDSTGVLMVPVSDEKAFVALLDRLNLNVKEDKQDGSYSFTPPGGAVDGAFRFANKYCYLTALNKSAIDKTKLLDPATVLPENLTAALSLTARFDRIPDSIKQLALSQLELKVADEQDRDLPNETPAQKKLRVALGKEFARRMKQLFTEGQAATFRFDVDRKTDQLVVELSLTGKSGSKLATEIAELGTSKGLFSSSIGGDSAMNFMLRMVLPAEVQKAMGPVIDEGIKEGLAKEKDAGRREAARLFLDALAPSLKSGDIDFMASLRGPTAEKHYGLVIGVKIKDGKKLDQAFRDMAKTFKEEEQAKIKFDDQTIGAVKVHKFDITKKDIDEKAQAFFGEHPLYMAFRNDALIFAFGEGGLAALKEALTAKPTEGPQFQFETGIKRLSLAMERETPDVAKYLEEAFAKGKNNDTIRLSVESGAALKARFVIKTPVVKFFALIGQARQAAAATNE